MRVRRISGRRGCVAAAAIAAIALLALVSQFAAAKGGGQIGESFGTPGVAAGQFFNPAMLGVDNQDGTIYTGDYTGVLSAEASNFRIQQLSASGEFKASAEVKRFPETGKNTGLQGIAVDHELGRIYMIESCRVAPAGGTFACRSIAGGKYAARKILVFSTTPEAGKLKALTSIALPEGENELYEPKSIAVDPSNHDLVLLGEENAKHKLIERVSSAGVLGARFVDSGDVLKPGSGNATSLAVSPTGVTYTVIGQETPGSIFTRAWQLPTNLSSLTEVPGFTAAAVKENWVLGHESRVEAVYGGPQLAISADGSTLYWKDSHTNSSPTEAGDLVVHGYSLSKGETTAIWGGGSSKCKITTSSAPLAASSGGNVVVFDTGAETAKTTDKPLYGLKMMTFGAGGTGCVEPVAKFTVNGKKEAEEITVSPGETVTFSAASSELAGGFRTELIWKFGDGSEKVVVPAIEGEEAPATVTHVYSSAAKVTVKLEIKLKSPIYGNPSPVERTFNVGSPVTGFKLKVTKGGTGSGTVTSSPAGISCGSTCEAEFASGKEVTLSAVSDPGSKAAVWSGCTTVTAGNECKVTLSAAKEVTASFTLETHQLTVSKTGTGTGTVTSSPAGINCGPTCAAPFDHGTVVILTGAPGANTKPVAWSGCDEIVGSNECKVTISAAKAVGAEFAPIPKFTLKVKRTGNGTGTVTSTPAGINCGPTCEAPYNEGTAVLLSAAPGANSKAAVWTGCDEVTAGNECKVSMSAAKEVTASFTLENHQLTVSRTGTGSGTVTSTPAGINCGGTCAAPFAHGTSVTLSGVADPGSQAVVWTGCDEVTAGNECKVTIGAAKAVGAEFAAIPKFTLKVKRTGNGTGTVTSSPAGINCGSTCEAPYNEGTVVTLSAAPGANSKAAVWTGCDEIVAGNECKVTIGAAKEVTAAFALEQHQLTVSKTGTGSGTVTSAPAGIECGPTCAAPFDHGSVVTLSAAADSGSKAVVWSGCGEVTAGNECKVTMGAAKGVGAKFDLVPGQKLLKVKKAGNGSGTVSSNPAGIECGSGCEAGFTEGTAITLGAASDPGSKAAVWSGCDEVTAGNECKVTLSAAKEVTASFTLETHQLTVSKTGTGTGTVTSSPAGINCGGTCAAPFDHGTVVTLSAAPGANTKPVVWSGCDEIVGTNECKVTISAAKAVGAEFAPIPKFTLKVKRTGNGTGTVTSIPAGISCGSTCEAPYNEGAAIVLSAAPGANSKAAVWSGCDEVTAGNECKVTLSAAKEVTAAFALETHQLTVTKTGTGSGTVTSAPAGINCGPTCAAPFDHGTVVTLSGAPGANTEPVVWTGCGEIVGSNECRVTVSAAKSVGAKFAAIPGQFALKVKKTGNGTGAVTSTPAGINCGPNCEATYVEGTTVTLIGAAGANTKPVAWTGCDEIVGSNECKVSMSAVKEVTASFTLETHQLTVSKTGSGTGTVTSSPAGINCGSTCAAPFDHGTAVILSGVPDSGSKPVVWTGCDEVTAGNECKVSMSAAKGVGAKFDLVPGQFLLKVAKTGSGSGAVTSSPAGINCGSTCEATYVEGTAVTLSGAAGANTKPVVWSGCDEIVGTNECKVTLSAAKEVSASFALETHQLTVVKTGSGTGTLTSSPAGINCGSTCAAEFDAGAEVTLTPVAASGSEFKGWSGACTGTGACTVTISAAKSVGAEFALIPGQFALKVKKTGSGSGTVTSSPAGIDCGSSCEASFAEGTAVVLSATSAANTKAVVWTGCDEVTAGNECKVTLSAAKEVSASFALETHQLTVSKTGTGTGTVTSSPTGINCGSACAASFDHGTVVTLSPAAAEGSEFTGWSGACSGTGACQVSVDAATAVSAGFDLKPSTPPTEPTPPPTPKPVETVPAPRSSLIGPPLTVAGPSSEIVDFGGVAMASDGSGGVVYVKSVEGVPHVFANRYFKGKWGAAIRVDADQPYGGDQPRIAAGNGGELLVVWVGPLATVHSQTRYGLFSAAIGRGGSSFGPSQVIDSNVGEGTDVGIDPSLSGTASGQAIVAYRVITYRFDGSKLAAQLRPGDVLADIRVARLKEDRWSGLGAINVNQELSTRAPSAANGPKVGAGIDGGAVVAWQEPDQSGTARIYTRRIFGTVLGPILQASPSSWAGVPVTGDVDAFSLAVTPLDQARIAMRIAGNGGEAPARIFLNTLPPGFNVPSNALVGAKQVFAAESASTALGIPGVAAYEKGGQEGLLRLGFVVDSRAQQTGAEQSGTLAPITTPTAPVAVPGAEAVTALNPEGGGTVAYPALNSNGRIALAVRQEFADRSAQVGLLSGRQQGGPIAELRISGSGKGDALIGFRQGEPGHYQIVADRVSARPSAFHVKAPKKWTKPGAVRLKWGAAGSAAGGVTYTVLIGGRPAKRGLRRHVFRPRPDQLGDGTRAARVMATDAFGQQVLSKPVKLQIDGQPPLIRLHGPSGRGLLVRVLDADSGPKAKATWVKFGDGTEARGQTKARHVYAAPGRYRVLVHSSDNAGNRVTRSFEVRVR